MIIAPTDSDFNENPDPRRTNLRGQFQYYLSLFRNLSEKSAKERALSSVHHVVLELNKINDSEAVNNALKVLHEYYKNENDPLFKGVMLQTLISYGFDSPDYESLLYEGLNDNEVVIRHVQTGLSAFFYRKNTSYENTDIEKICDSLFPTLSSKDKEIVRATLLILKRMFDILPENKSSELRNILCKNPMKSKLNDLMNNHSESRIKTLANEVIKKAKEENIIETNTALRPLSYTLSPVQMAELRDQIQGQGSLPRDFLCRCFGTDTDNGELNKRIIFINHEFTLDNALKDGIIEDILYVNNKFGPIHLGLELSFEASKEFESFLSGRDEAGFISNLKDNLVFREEGFDIAKENFRLQMNRLKAEGIKIFLFGEKIGLIDELAFENRTSNLAQYLAEYKHSKIITYSRFTRSSFALNDLGEAVSSSRKALREKLSNKISNFSMLSLFEQTEGFLSINALMGRLNNLDQFLDMYPIPTSFGMLLGNSNFDPLRFYISFSDTYSSAWNGIIFRKDNHEEDPDFFRTPQIPRPVILSPSRGPSLILT